MPVNPILIAPVEVFYSYSHRDEELREQLEKHLSILKRQGKITAWYDRKISAGKEWEGQIDSHLNSARVMLLLISADFLASDYCYDVEMKRALERDRAGEARVIPVILRSCEWKGAPFGRLQALPKDGKAITSWQNQDEAFTDVARGIRTVIDELVDSSHFSHSDSEVIHFREVKALVGIAVDLSGSMAESMRNETGERISRLESFRRSINKLADQAKKSIHENQTRKIDTSIDLFALGFGIREIGICDLLSLMKVGQEVITKEEIEELKRRYTREMQDKYRGYEGTGDLVKSLGLGSLIPEVEGILKAGAEQTIRKRIMLQISKRLEAKLSNAGDTTMPIEEIARLWDKSSDVLANSEEFIFGDTPMRLALSKVVDRFKRELKSRDRNTKCVLFILSDGEPTDGDPSVLADEMKSMDVTIISCFVTNQDIANPRVLFNRYEPGWTSGARLMFDIASIADSDSEITRFLSRKGWTIEPKPKLFVQLNHTVILDEFLRVTLSPFEEDAGSIRISPRGI